MLVLARWQVANGDLTGEKVIKSNISTYYNCVEYIKIYSLHSVIYICRVCYVVLDALHNIRKVVFVKYIIMYISHFYLLVSFFNLKQRGIQFIDIGSRYSFYVL